MVNGFPPNNDAQALLTFSKLPPAAQQSEWSMFFRMTMLAIAAWSSSAAAIEINQVSENVWAATQPEQRRFNDCNSLIVEADDYVIVVDTQESDDDVNQIITFVHDSIKKPVRFLINTHWHGDHTQGNTHYRDIFGDKLVIIGHTTHTADIFERADVDLKARVVQTRDALPAAREQLLSGIKRDGSKFTDAELEAQTERVENTAAWVIANEDVIFTGPTFTVSEPYSVSAGDASFTIYPMRGHTRGDLVVHFPQSGIVATGDLVDEMPYAGHGYPKEWIASLASIQALRAERYLPGHGALLVGNTLIGKLTRYFSSLVHQVQILHRDGKSAEEIKAEIDLSDSRKSLAGDDETAGRFFDRVQGEAIDRVIAELDAVD